MYLRTVHNFTEVGGNYQVGYKAVLITSNIKTMKWIWAKNNYHRQQYGSLINISKLQTLWNGKFEILVK